jgi:hypothetical protein
MDQLPAEFTNVYKLLGLGAVDLAVRGGKIDVEKASALRKLLENTKSKTKNEK